MFAPFRPVRSRCSHWNMIEICCFHDRQGSKQPSRPDGMPRVDFRARPAGRALPRSSSRQSLAHLVQLSPSARRQIRTSRYHAGRSRQPRRPLHPPQVVRTWLKRRALSSIEDSACKQAMICDLFVSCCRYAPTWLPCGQIYGHYHILPAESVFWCAARGRTASSRPRTMLPSRLVLEFRGSFESHMLGLSMCCCERAVTLFLAALELPLAPTADQHR